MTMSGASYRERVESDPMLTPEYIEAVRRAYAGDRDLHDPDLSPLLGDLCLLYTSCWTAAPQAFWNGRICL